MESESALLFFRRSDTRKEEKVIASRHTLPPNKIKRGLKEKFLNSYFYHLTERPMIMRSNPTSPFKYHCGPILNNNPIPNVG